MPAHITGPPPRPARPAPPHCACGPPGSVRFGTDLPALPAPAGQNAGMRIDLASAPGHPERPNEDWVSAAIPASGGGVLVVLDGVTPLGRR